MATVPGPNPAGAVIYTSDKAAVTTPLETAWAGYTGASYAPGLLHPTDTVTFKVNAPSAGVYTGQLRYSAAVGSTVTINGTPVTLASTAAWTTWAFAPFSVTLAAGSAVSIVIAGASTAAGQYVNVDRVDLLSPASAAGPGIITPPAMPVSPMTEVPASVIAQVEADAAQVEADAATEAADAATEATDAKGL